MLLPCWTLRVDMLAGLTLEGLNWTVTGVLACGVLYIKHICVVNARVQTLMTQH